LVNVNVGTLIRRERQRQGLSLRALARRVGVSASMLSQVETGRTRPSVSTIYGIATELGLSIDALLSDADTHADAHADAHSDTDMDTAQANATAGAAANTTAGATAGASAGASANAATNAADTRAHRVSAPSSSSGLACHFVPPEERRKLELESGVTWELLSDLLPHLVDFMYVTYEPGGSSSSSGKLMRHTGTEFAYLLRGKLKIQVGFDEFILQPGDALAFDSSEPHLLVNEGTEPAEGIWFVLGRRLTPESHAARVALPESRGRFPDSDDPQAP
jgi:transcriptional regulator with XRE-family HTH domain/quercetin dioxygenase-like cupin family protein